MKYRIIVCGSFTFVFYKNTYEEAIKFVKDKWFSPSVWDIRLFEDDKEIDISELIKSWGERPVYC